MYLSILNKFKNPTTGRFFINNNDHKQILHKQRFFVKQDRKKASVGLFDFTKQAAQSYKQRWIRAHEIINMEARIFFSFGLFITHSFNINHNLLVSNLLWKSTSFYWLHKTRKLKLLGQNFFGPIKPNPSNQDHKKIYNWILIDF